MDKLPSPAWAIGLAILGVVVSLCVLYSSAPENIKLQVLAVASSLVAGALGAFAGHASSENRITGSNPVVNQTPVLPQTDKSEE